MKKIPRAAQAERIQRFLDEPTNAALVADEPGVGKTVVGAEIAVQGGFERVLFVGVKDTYHQWAETLLEQSDGEAVLRRIDSTKAGKQALADMLAGLPGLYFSGLQYLTAQDWAHVPVLDAEGNPEMVLDKKTKLPTDKQKTKRKHLGTYKKMKKHPLELVVFDEVHMIANRLAVGRATLGTIPTERKLALSGTPGGNSFEGMWSVTRWLWPELIDPQFARWRRDWCTTEDVYIGKDEPVVKVTGERTPGLFVSTLPLYFRQEAEPLPASLVAYVELTPAQRAQYTALEQDLMVWIGEHPLVVEAPVVLGQRLRTATLGEMSITADGEIFFDMGCASSKLEVLSHILAGWGGEQVIIGVDSKRFAKVTVARMRRAGLAVEEWTGDVTSKARDAIKARFLAGKTQYIVATIQSMSTGLDGFQAVCSKMVWLNELVGNPTVNEQFVRRLFRPGRVGEFQSVKIIARDTTDDPTYEQNLLATARMRAELRTAA